MAYNNRLEERIEQITGGWHDMESKNMFGGVCYLVRGNMCFGIYKDFLIVRMDKEESERLLEEDGNVQPFDITGRPMKGWLMVAEPGWSKPQELARWLETGREFALTLPPK